ncbi:MAG: 50S ribosomal protein L11 methyltransferase [Kofleriaceae bacterium]
MTQNIPARISRIAGDAVGLLSTANIDELLEPVDRLIDDCQFDTGYNLLKRLRTVIGPHSQLDRRLDRIYRASVPRWHFAMLNDRDRNRAFAEAIVHSNVRGKTVLDIGAGTGLLSMLAAKHGAAHVYACEMVAPVADKAVEIIAANGYADKVTLIPKISHDIRIGADMPQRAEVLISETIDCGFVGEGFLSSLRHAKSELLTPNATLVPRRFTLEGALLESSDVFGLNRIDEVEGFDLGGFNELATRGYFPVRLNTWRHRLMSAPSRLLGLDLASYAFTPVSETLELTANTTGVVHGVVFWFDVELVAGIRLSNTPCTGASHWMQAFTCFERPIAVAKGDQIVLDLSFSQSAVDITYVGCRGAVRSAPQAS